MVFNVLQKVFNDTLQLLALMPAKTLLRIPFFVIGRYSLVQNYYYDFSQKSLEFLRDMRGNILISELGPLGNQG
jgi:hypothetical protein